MDYKEEITKILKKEIRAEINLEIPPDNSLGDYAFPCFSLSKIYRKNPVEIANELKAKIEKEKIPFIEKVEVKGPYVNFFIKKIDIIKDTLKKILDEKEKYGASRTGKNKKALIEHTSINPNASPHVGRARNALIGDSIVRILKFQGYDVETHYFVNDVGKQIAMLVLGCGNARKKIEFDDLLKIYVEINKKAEANPEIEKQIFGLLNELEKKDKKTIKRFKDVVGICIKGQTKIFSELGIKYDEFDYESGYLWKNLTKEVLEKLKKTGKLFTDDEGRLVLNQEGHDLAMKSPVLVLTRADGTSLYPLRDLAYTTDKINKKADRNILVLGEDHKLYFQQIKAALELLNLKAPEAVHYSHVLLQESKMSTREGNLVLLEDFMKEARQKAEKEILKREPKISKKLLEKNSRIIGYGAIKYSILRVSAEKNVNFNWERALNFEGDSGPYMQYAYVRACSILKKYGKEIDEKIDYSLLNSKEEVELIKKMSEFKNTVDDATENLRPHMIANYLSELAKLFSEFYHACQILKEDEDLKKARLLLVSCAKQVLENGLKMLGIDVLERM
ncbi:MAG: arginine--tRNA ligase [Candidatus Woesearchaeota archaeon]|nr:arginine--tRNA ligase [Candidatus Woesearchaeota archaeon]